MRRKFRGQKMGSSGESSFRVTGGMLRFVGVLLSLAAAYFLTIQSLRVDLTGKAESEAVEKLDRKLANIEVILREGVVNREQFYEFSKEMESRLSRIEFYLKQKSGENTGEN